MRSRPTAMLVNVGNATSPAIHILNEQQPRFICFFVSEDTKGLISSRILPDLKYQPEHYDWIKTPAPQSMHECFRVLLQELPRILQKWDVAPETLGVEYTAGTKPMSVAAVLATIDTCARYFYVGTADAAGRNNDGIGVVLDGREYSWYQTNPWEELAVQSRREIAMLFNLGRFADAQDRALRLAKVVPADMQKVFETLAELIDGYSLWDRFEYRSAQAKIFKASAALNLYVAGRDEPLRATLDTVATHADFLRRLNEKGEEAQRLDVLDMLANADRRATVAQRYDDAVARLYSVLEAIARNRLLGRFKIKTSATRLEQLPEHLRGDYQRQFGDPANPTDVLRIGLDGSYRLLADLGDEIGEKYLAVENDLKQVLLARNLSRLAHGTEPVRRDTFERMRGFVVNFAEVSENDIPIFPQLRL